MPDTVVIHQNGKFPPQLKFQPYRIDGSSCLASTQAKKTHFHKINTKTGHRLKQHLVDEQTWA
jgi:hypothetical protein